MRAISSALVVCLVACASSPQEQDDARNALMQSLECEVWVQASTGIARATVRKGVAEMGGHPLSSFQEPGVIVLSGSFGTIKAALLQGRNLDFQERLRSSDKPVVIGDSMTQMDGAFGAITFYNNQRCTIPDAALGIVAITAAATAHYSR